HCLAQEEPGGVHVELRLARFRAVERDAVLGQERLELRELAHEVLARIARAQERENVFSVLPDERGRQAERGVVLGLKPELQHELRLAAVVSLVEMEAELP